MRQERVWLNGVSLPIEGEVLWRRVTPFAAQITSGAQTIEDYTPTRKQLWGPFKGGMGKEKHETGENDRYWYADGVDCSRNLATLGPEVTSMGTFGARPVRILKFRKKIWAIGNNQISYWTGAAWQSVKTDFANPTDALVFLGDA